MGHAVASGRSGHASTSAPSSKVKVDSSDVSSLREALRGTADQARTLANHLKDVREHLGAIGAARMPHLGGMGGGTGGTGPGSGTGRGGSYLPGPKQQSPYDRVLLGGGTGNTPTPADQPAAESSKGNSYLAGAGMRAGKLLVGAAVLGEYGARYLNRNLNNMIDRQQASQSYLLSAGQNTTYAGLQRASMAANKGFKGNLGYADVTQAMNNQMQVGAGAGSAAGNRFMTSTNQFTALDPTLGAGKASAMVASLTSVSSYYAGRMSGVDMSPGRSMNDIFTDIVKRISTNGVLSQSQINYATTPGSRLNHNLKFLGLSDDMIVEFQRWAANKYSNGGKGVSLNNTLGGAAQRRSQSQGNLQTNIDKGMIGAVETAMGLQTRGNNALAGLAGTSGGQAVTEGLGFLGQLDHNVRLIVGLLGVRGLMGLMSRMAGISAPGLLGGARTVATRAAAAGGAGFGALGGGSILAGGGIAAGALAGGAAILGGFQQGGQSNLNKGMLARGSQQGRHNRGTHWWDVRRYDTWKEQTAHNLFGHIPGLGGLVDRGTGYKYDKLAADHLASKHDTPVQGCPLCDQGVPNGQSGSNRARGGMVPGNHNRDDVPISATPGEVVVPKHIVNKFGGAKSLMEMLGFQGHGAGNYATGGEISAIIKTAESFVGQPYKWGGSTPATSFDCSGLMQWSFGQHGVHLPRVAQDQQKSGSGVSAGREISGDLLFYGMPAHHEAMYLGGGKMIEAPHTGANIRIVSERTPTNIRRIIGGGGADMSNVSTTTSGGKSARKGDSGDPNAPAFDFTFGSQNSGDFLAALLGAAGNGALKGSSASTATGAASPTNVSAPGAMPTGNVASWIAAAMKVLGKSNKKFAPGLSQLIQHESGGDPHSINTTDSNAKAGHPSKGIMQMIDGTFGEYALPGHGNIWNPVDNIISGFRYAERNYGDAMIQAGGRHNARGNYIGYARGNYQMVSDEIAKLHQGEMVLNSRDSKMMREVVEGRPTGSKGGGSRGACIHVSGSWTFQVASASEDDARKFAHIFKATLKEDHRITSVQEGA